MAQTSYDPDFSPAVAGMQADNGFIDVLDFVASEEIFPGRVVELDPATATDDQPKVRNPQATSAAIAKPAGIAMYTPGKEPTSSYKAGDVVPCMRKGRIWAESVAGTVSCLSAASVAHSSTIATDRGKVTDAASSGTAGTEVDATGIAKFLRAGPAGSGLAKVEINLP